MPTQSWLYYAASSKADADRTFELAINDNVIIRNVENVNGALIAGVGRLQPGDRIALVFRGLRAGLIATLAEPTEPHHRAPAVQVLHGEFAKQLAGSDYKLQGGDTLEVLLLEEVERFCLSSDVPNLGMGTLHCITDTDLEKQIWNSRTDSSVEGKTSFERSAEPTSRGNASPIDTRTSSAVPKGTDSPDQKHFDSYLMIDWSSRNEPTTGPDSIWIAYINADERTEAKNFSTRKECVAWLKETLSSHEKQELRTLVGFDFAFGYPKGYVRLLGASDWRELIGFYAANIQDNENNNHNRDDFARSINHRIGIGPGPFWGVVNNAACDFLESRRVGRFTFPYIVDDISLDEFRITEHASRKSGATPQSVWKLNQGVAVGGQAIVGIPYLHELLTELKSIKAWPFETGWSVDEESVTLLVEIFPSLISTERYAVQLANGEICRDEAQVRSCCDFALELDQKGVLADYFRCPSALAGDELLAESIRTEEGWILWSNMHEDN